MDRFDYLDRRRQAELNHADLAICPVEKRKHEEQARAYSKIISVLRREEEASLHAR
ncbi:hypothetical protein [Sphingobium chungbukense]|uniref:hypothetical protein n=1 Tax=Sphingobium chungbukense TaxID=56193 RepID=UPI000A55839A|nr:hypothetical protein [Sphingobium chungbukense]